MKKMLLYLLEPKLITFFGKNSYHKSHFMQDILSGLSVAIVALPLAMAIAIASNFSPEKRTLYCHNSSIFDLRFGR